MNRGRWSRLRGCLGDLLLLGASSLLALTVADALAGESPGDLRGGLRREPS